MQFGQYCGRRVWVAIFACDIKLQGHKEAAFHSVLSPVYKLPIVDGDRQ
jgi:hypothetical protein